MWSICRQMFSSFTICWKMSIKMLNFQTQFRKTPPNYCFLTLERDLLRDIWDFCMDSNTKLLCQLWPCWCASLRWLKQRRDGRLLSAILWQKADQTTVSAQIEKVWKYKQIFSLDIYNKFQGANRIYLFIILDGNTGEIEDKIVSHFLPGWRAGRHDDLLHFVANQKSSASPGMVQTQEM